MAGLVFVGASGVVPPERAGAASPLGEFLVYYGWPSHINGAAGPSAAAAELGRYDFVALGSSAEDPDHPDHARTAAILADPAMAGTYVFGYVNLGVTNGSLSLDEVRTRIDGWRAIGADAILFDAFGYDFGVTRERQNAAVEYAHSLGMPVLANAWFPADVFGAAADPVANPGGVPSLLGAADFYLSESYRVMLGQLVPEGQWRTKAGELAGYQSQLGFSILSVTTNTPANLYVEELFFTAWNAAAADGHLAIGWGEYLFSAVDGQAPYRARPGAVDPPDDGGGGVVDPPDDGGGGVLDPPGGDTNPPPVLCAGVPATIVGTPGDDRLLGTEGRDVIAGLGGRDVIFAGGGDDLVCGGGGDDVISGGAGNDRLLGGPGSDELSGDAGDDVALGGGGDDRLAGGEGSDVLRGQGGDDRLEGGEGDDRLIGGAGADELFGDGGDDRLFGQGGDDLLQGWAGVDWARGGPQTDSCEAERTFTCEA